MMEFTGNSSADTSFMMLEDEIGMGEYHDYDGYDMYQAPSEFHELMSSNVNDSSSDSTVLLASKVCLGIVYVSMIIICTIADTLMCLCVWRYPKIRNVMNMLLTSLAVSDLLVASFSAPIFMDYYIHQDWRFGLRACQLSGYIKNSSLYVSTTCLVAIAIYRYILIRFPHKDVGSTLQVGVLILIIWIYSFTLALPTAIYAKLGDIYRFNDEVVAHECIEDWPKTSRLSLEVYDIVIFILGYVMPVLISSFCYGGIAVKLWRPRGAECTGGNENNHQPVHYQSKISTYRAFRMLIAVFTFFVVCWTPYYCLLIYKDFIMDKDHTRDEQSTYITIYYAVETVAMSNSMFNAIINIVMNEKVWAHCCDILHLDRILLRCGCETAGLQKAGSIRSRVASPRGRLASVKAIRTQHCQDNGNNGHDHIEFEERRKSLPPHHQSSDQPLIPLERTNTFSEVNSTRQSHLHPDCATDTTCLGKQYSQESFVN